MRSRIVRHADVDPRSITPHPGNWRLHPEPQRQALEGILGRVGFVQSIIVSERSGRLLDGHLRLQVAIDSKAETIPAVFVDVDESEEKLILASLDPSAAMAVTDEQKLTELLADLESVNGSFDGMLASLLDASFGFTGDLAGEPEGDAPAESAADGDAKTGRSGGDPKHRIRPVLYAPQVAVFERAIRATGLPNRGNALIAVCEGYLATRQ